MVTKYNYSIPGLLAIDVEQMHEMSTDDLIDMVRGMVNKTRRRARGLEVHNMEKYDIPYKRLMKSGGYSFDMNKYRKNADGTVRRNDLIADALRYQQFLESKTSTYTGLMDWNRNVENTFGRSFERKADMLERQAQNVLNPFDGSMTDEAKSLYDKVAKLREDAERHRQMYRDLAWEQKSEYWKLVDEIKNTGEFSTMWGSDPVQSMILEEETKGGPEFDQLTFDERVERLKEILRDRKKEALHKFH